MSQAYRVDFDILGVLWLLQNVAPLAMVAMTFVSAGVAIYCWVRSAAGG
jgi:hypothetical protein